MPSVETIYQNSVRPLPQGDQMRLAEIILERDAKPRGNSQRRSVIEIIETARASAPSRSAAEIDEYLKAERDSWSD